MTSFGHSKPCQKTIHIYASLSLIISLIKLMSINYAYNNKKNLTWIFMKGAGCYNGTPIFEGPLVRSHLSCGQTSFGAYKSDQRLQTKSRKQQQQLSTALPPHLL